MRLHAEHEQMGRGTRLRALNKMLRKHPTHISNIERHNKPVLLFVTVCALDRTVNTFATDEMHRILKEAWASAQSHHVGAYVLMPDHIHLFCAPASLESENVAKWVQYWKALVTKRIRSGFVLGGSGICRTGAQTRAAPGEGHASACLGRADVPHSEAGTGGSRACATPGAEACAAPGKSISPLGTPKSIFQRDCWDTQLRAGENYHEKWEYVRDNPVRKGLAASADEWPYCGVNSELMW